MTNPDSSLPDDFLKQIQEPEKSHLLPYLLLGVAALLLAGLYLFFSPEEEISLEPPLDPSKIDPIIRAQIEAAKQPLAPESRPEKSTLPVPTPLATAKTEPQLLTEPASMVTTIETPQTTDVAPRPTLTSAGDEARSLIRSLREGNKSLTLEELFSQASQFQKSAKPTDAYLLYFYAARQGHGESAFQLGSMNDPAHFTGESEFLEKPDPVQAQKWYSIAAASQVAGAEQRLQALRKQVEIAAKSGDPSAQRLLLNWR